MLADFETRFDQHNAMIRRAEANYDLMAALTSGQPARTVDQPRKRLLSALLRRIAGTPATA
jgi:hypothetical protein